eukprot:TRINITY_DN43683_c0_g1_i1.p1 TRINITY_DN43683_c0_g1~~TRINITY_DN43683_c0_g1_i1.p1  ORF type:complete len:647 (+),score=135.17 TRINITY_DN43683_c0_g1_i1:40-1941(+)
MGAMQCAVVPEQACSVSEGKFCWIKTAEFEAERASGSTTWIKTAELDKALTCDTAKTENVKAPGKQEDLTNTVNADVLQTDEGQELLEEPEGEREPSELNFVPEEASSEKSTMSRSTSSEWILPAEGKLTVLMFGMTGAGKSSLGNLIAGTNAFTVSDSTASVTNLDSIMRYEAEDGSLVLLDTIGLGDTELDQEHVVESIREIAISAANGVDVLFYVLKNTRLTDDAIARLIYCVEYLWGDECLLNLYVVVTNASRYLRSPEEGRAWIEKQLDNWRFAYIYKLVGNNPNRFIFVDNPDIESGEPLVAERQLASRNVLMKALALHPSEIIPPWTSERMKEAQARTQTQRAELELKEVEVKNLEVALGAASVRKKKKASRRKAATQARQAGAGQDPTLASKPQLLKDEAGSQMSLSDVSNCSVEDERTQKALSKAKKQQKEAEKAYKQALAKVAADPAFKENARRDAQHAANRFRKTYATAEETKDAYGQASGPVQACKRLISSFLPLGRLSITSNDKSEPGKSRKKQRSSISKGGGPTRAGDKTSDADVIARLMACIGNASPDEVYKRMDKLSNSKVSPVSFRRFINELKLAANPTQVGMLWRRIDKNCDGHISREEWHDFLQSNGGRRNWRS